MTQNDHNITINNKNYTFSNFCFIYSQHKIKSYGHLWLEEKKIAESDKKLFYEFILKKIGLTNSVFIN